MRASRIALQDARGRGNGNAYRKAGGYPQRGDFRAQMVRGAPSHECLDFGSSAPWKRLCKTYIAETVLKNMVGGRKV